MNENFYLKNIIKTIAFIVFILIVILCLFLFKKAAIGAHRHALNHLEYSKDNYNNELIYKCPEINNYYKNIEQYHDNKLIHQALASDDVFRYIAYDHKLLKNERCISSIMVATQLQKYNFKLFFIDPNGVSLVISTYFKGE
jgi:hypothetical protein